MSGQFSNKSGSQNVSQQQFGSSSGNIQNFTQPPNQQQVYQSANMQQFGTYSAQGSQLDSQQGRIPAPQRQSGQINISYGSNRSASPESSFVASSFQGGAVRNTSQQNINPMIKVQSPGMPMSQQNYQVNIQGRNMSMQQGVQSGTQQMRPVQFQPGVPNQISYAK